MQPKRFVFFTSTHVVATGGLYLTINSDRMMLADQIATHGMHWIVRCEYNLFSGCTLTTNCKPVNMNAVCDWSQASYRHDIDICFDSQRKSMHVSCLHVRSQVLNDVFKMQVGTSRRSQRLESKTTLSWIGTKQRKRTGNWHRYSTDKTKSGSCGEFNAKLQQGRRNIYP